MEGNLSGTISSSCLGLNVHNTRTEVDLNISRMLCRDDSLTLTLRSLPNLSPVPLLHVMLAKHLRQKHRLPRPPGHPIFGCPNNAWPRPLPPQPRLRYLLKPEGCLRNHACVPHSGPDNATPNRYDLTYAVLETLTLAAP